MALYVGCPAYLTVCCSALFNDDDYADSATMTILSRAQNIQLNRQEGRLKQSVISYSMYKMYISILKFLWIP